MLVRRESELVRTEVSEKLSQATKAGQLMSLGAALLLGAFLVQLQAVVQALNKFIDPLWAAVVVGLGVGLLSYSLVKSATRKIGPAHLSPDRSVRQLRKPCSSTIAR